MPCAFLMLQVWVPSGARSYVHVWDACSSLHACRQLWVVGEGGQYAVLRHGFVSMQVAQESLGLSRVVRAFGTEEKESNRYIRCTHAHQAIMVP